MLHGIVFVVCKELWKPFIISCIWKHLGGYLHMLSPWMESYLVNKNRWPCVNTRKEKNMRSCRWQGKEKGSQSYRLSKSVCQESFLFWDRIFYWRIWQCLQEHQNSKDFNPSGFSNNGYAELEYPVYPASVLMESCRHIWDFCSSVHLNRKDLFATPVVFYVRLYILHFSIIAFWCTCDLIKLFLKLIQTMFMSCFTWEYLWSIKGLMIKHAWCINQEIVFSNTPSPLIFHIFQLYVQLNNVNRQKPF